MVVTINVMTIIQQDIEKSIIKLWWMKHIDNIELVFWRTVKIQQTRNRHVRKIKSSDSRLRFLFDVTIKVNVRKLIEEY